jgi:DNA-binding transcriptional MerR regulator
MPDDSTIPESAEQGYRAPRAAKVAGITYRQLDYWARQNYVRPSLVDARGSGSQRLYSFRDLLKLKVMKQLLDQGLSLQKTRGAIQALEAAGEDVASARLVLAGPRALLVHSDGEVSDVLSGQGVLALVLPMSGVVEELNAAITTLPAAESDEAPAVGRAAESPVRKAASGG